MKLKEIEEFLTEKKAVYSDFNHLDILDFPGVYILVDPVLNDEIVYVGSSYVRGVKTRMVRHKAVSESNNLAREIIKLDSDISALTDRKEQLKAAVNKIKTFKIIAIEHKDLENQIIGNTKPKYNRNGNI